MAVGARERRNAIRHLAYLRGGWPRPKDALAATKQAECAFDAASDRFDAAERALDEAREERAQARQARYTARQSYERASMTADRLARRVREMAERLDRMSPLPVARSFRESPLMVGVASRRPGDNDGRSCRSATCR